MWIIVGFLGAALAALLIYMLFRRLERAKEKAVAETNNIMMAKLEYRDELLYAANRATAFLLNSDISSFADNLFQAMETMGRAAKVDRMYIWKNSVIEGELYCTQVYEWSEGAEPQQGNEYTVDISYKDHVPYWGEMLSQEKCVNSFVRDLPKNEREHLEAQGVLSILAVPIFIKDEFWGFMGFDDCSNERLFNEEEETILHSSSLLFANAWLRYEVELEIKEANELTAMMLDSSPLCAKILGRNLNIINCNAAALNMYGFRDKHEYIERFMQDCSPEYQPDGQRSSEKTRMILTKAFDEGYWSGEWMHRIPGDGTLMPSEITLVRVRYKDDYVVIEYTRDLRKYKEMMAEIGYRDKMMQAVNQAAVILLNAEPESFEDALRQSMEIIARSVNVDCIYLWKNHTIDRKLYCAQIFEWSKQETVFKEGQLYAYSEVVPGWEETLSGGKTINSIVRDMSPEEQAHLAPSGIMSIFVAPIFLEEQFWGFVGFDDNHNERLFTENEESTLRSGSIIIANSFLLHEMLLNIRDTSVRLESALEQADAASKAKSSFLSTMSHEMRTPMNAIIGMAAIGNKASDIEEKNYALSKIGEASSHLLSLINDVLDMAKIEANKLELASVEYNFERMLQNVMTVINFRVEEKNQTITVDIDDAIPRFVVGDDHRLSQVITNLMANAVKFTPPGGRIHFRAALAGEEDGVCELLFTVTDSGIGISPEQQKRLFQPFEQAASGTSREYGGTGLGLVITKRIVELMGGGIRVESELGKGAAFIFTVKAGRGKKNPASLLAPGVNWETVRIMVVDDMPEIREHFRNMFSELNITCDFASDGIEAFRMIEGQGDYDIYFIDWRMPRMDGIELTKQIKSRNRGRPCVVIMITAMDWEQIKEDAASAGVDKHLLKPLFSSTVIDCINECLGTSDTDVRTDDGYISGEFTGKRMLLAEDVEINREILTALLEDTGIIIDCAENGQEALDMIAAAPGKYDIVFMDVQMPKMDGYESTRRIRALPSSSSSLQDDARLPIIAMTANVFKSDIEACIAAGMDAHLGKPLDIEKVLKALRKYLK